MATARFSHLERVLQIDSEINVFMKSIKSGQLNDCDRNMKIQSVRARRDELDIIKEHVKGEAADKIKAVKIFAIAELKLLSDLSVKSGASVCKPGKNEDELRDQRVEEILQVRERIIEIVSRLRYDFDDLELDDVTEELSCLCERLPVLDRLLDHSFEKRISQLTSSMQGLWDRFIERRHQWKLSQEFENFESYGHGNSLYSSDSEDDDEDEYHSLEPSTSSDEYLSADEVGPIEREESKEETVNPSIGENAVEENALSPNVRDFFELFEKNRLIKASLDRLGRGELDSREADSSASFECYIRYLFRTDVSFVDSVEAVSSIRFLFKDENLSGHLMKFLHGVRHVETSSTLSVRKIEPEIIADNRNQSCDQPINIFKPEAESTNDNDQSIPPKFHWISIITLLLWVIILILVKSKDSNKKRRCKKGNVFKKRCKKVRNRVQFSSLQGVSHIIDPHAFIKSNWFKVSVDLLLGLVKRKDQQSIQRVRH